jgi:hypothetical protein
MHPLWLCLLLAIGFFTSCHKKDAVLTPQQEAEYARMMANAREPSYDELRRENEELKDRESRR